MKEPSVIIQMSADVIPTITTAGQNIAAGIIIAECGTLKPKLFNSSGEVIKEFTKSGTLTRNSDTTLIHAAAIADVMPVLLKRSYDDDGTRAGFGIYKNPAVVGDNCVASLKSFAKVSDDIDYELKGKIGDSKSSEVLGSVQFEGISSNDSTGVTAKAITVKPNSKYNEVTLVVSKSSSFSYAFITNQLGEETYLDFSKAKITEETTDDPGEVVIDCGNLTSSSTLTIAFSEVVTMSDVEYIYKEKLTYKELLVKNGAPLLFRQEMEFSSPISIDPITFQILAANKLFYNETQPAPTAPKDYELVSISGIDRRSTSREVIDAINKQLKDSYIDFDGSSVYLYSEVTQKEYESGDYDNDLSESESLGVKDDFVMMVYSNYPSSIDFTAKVAPNKDNEDLFDLTVVTATRTYEYSGSLDPEFVNEYGANQFIENVNDYENIPFTISVLDNEFPAKQVPTTPTISFGKMNIGKGDGLSVRRSSLEELVDQDEVKIAFLCPFGYNNNSYLAKLSSYSTKIWAYNPIGLYCYKDDPEAIIANRPAINSEYSIIMAPHDRSTLMTDWVVDLTLEYAYLQKIMSNAAKSCEFAPMLGKDNASFQITKPSVIFKRSTREKLLDARIMSLITRKSQAVNYLNKNKCSGGDTILSEDQNARLACKINRDLDVLLEPIIGRYNTEETRGKVVTTINNYFTQNITNQIFSIDNYEVICDESNNTASVRANNQLVIDLKVTYLNAIYDVLVYHRALNVASNEE